MIRRRDRLRLCGVIVLNREQNELGAAGIVALTEEGNARNEAQADSGFGEGVYTLFDTSSAIIGSLNPNASSLTGIIGTLPGTLSIGDAGRDIVLTVIPEPSALTALFGGLGMLVGLGRLRRFQAGASRV